MIIRNHSSPSKKRTVDNIATIQNTGGKNHNIGSTAGTAASTISSANTTVATVTPSRKNNKHSTIVLNPYKKKTSSSTTLQRTITHTSQHHTFVQNPYTKSNITSTFGNSRDVSSVTQSQSIGIHSPPVYKSNVYQSKKVRVNNDDFDIESDNSSMSDFDEVGNDNPFHVVVNDISYRDRDMRNNRENIDDDASFAYSDDDAMNDIYDGNSITGETTQNPVLESISQDEDILRNFGVTPFGCFCSLCNQAVGGSEVCINSLKSHNQRMRKKGNLNHVKLTTTEWKEVVFDLNQKMEDTKSRKPYYSYVRKENCVAFYCTACDLILLNRRTKQKHLARFNMNRKKHNNKTSVKLDNAHKLKDCFEEVRVHRTVCGRWVTDEKVTGCHGLSELIQPSRLELTVESVRSMLEPYERMDEDIDPYLPIVLKWMIECRDKNQNNTIQRSVIDEITDIHRIWVDGSINKELTIFLAYGKKWLFEKATSSVASIGANYRSKLQSFDVKDTEDGTSMNQCFNIRKNTEGIWSEFEVLLTYIWHNMDST